MEEDLEGPWSDILSFGTSEIGGNDAPAPSETAPAEEVKPADNAKDSCPICHFCPQPLGLCIFIWLAILILAILIIILIIKAAKKGKKQEK